MPRYLPRRMEDIHPHENLYTTIDSSIIHNSQQVETTQVSVDRETDTKNVVHSQNGVLFGLTNEGSTNMCYDTDEPRRHNAQLKKSHTKEQTRYDSNYTKSPKQVNP